MDNIDTIIKEIEKDMINIEKIDEIFYDKLPKDLTKHIYSYINPICDDCYNCCKICSMYCYFNCLRIEGGRNVCNKSEFMTLYNRFYYKETEESKQEEIKES